MAREQHIQRLRSSVRRVRHVLGGLRSRARHGARERKKRLLWQASRTAFDVRNRISGGAPVQVHLDGAHFEMSAEGAIACDYWSRLRVETDELRCFRSLLRPRDVVFDVGANAGLFSLLAAADGGDRVSVVAIEPTPSTYRLLRANVALNGFGCITTVEAALAESEGKATLTLNAASRDGLNTIGRATHGDSDVVGSVEVRTTSLDALVDDLSVPRIDVMKIDAEGAERLIFAGGRRTLEADQAPVILFENYGWCTAGFDYHPIENVWLLERYGYELYRLLDDGRVRRAAPPELVDQFLIAAKPERIDRLGLSP